MEGIILVNGIIENHMVLAHINSQINQPISEKYLIQFIILSGLKDMQMVKVNFKILMVDYLEEISFKILFKEKEYINMQMDQYMRVYIIFNILFAYYIIYHSNSSINSSIYFIKAFSCKLAYSYNIY